MTVLGDRRIEIISRMRKQAQRVKGKGLSMVSVAVGAPKWVPGFAPPVRPAVSYSACVYPGGYMYTPRLTFWHPVNVHIKAQHEAAQPIGHAGPNRGRCKQDPCNTSLGEDPAAPSAVNITLSPVGPPIPPWVPAYP